MAKRFTLQLRSRLVLILAVGVLIFVNTRTRTGPIENVPLVQPQAGMVVHLWERASVRGWPADYYKSFKSGYAEWSTEGVVIDVLVALGIIGVAVGTCEWMVRRRARSESQQM